MPGRGGQAAAAVPGWAVLLAALVVTGLPALYLLQQGGSPLAAGGLLALAGVPLAVWRLLAAVSDAAGPARRR